MSIGEHRMNTSFDEDGWAITSSHSTLRTGSQAWRAGSWFARFALEGVQYSLDRAGSTMAGEKEGSRACGPSRRNVT